VPAQSWQFEIRRYGLSLEENLELVRIADPVFYSNSDVFYEAANPSVFQMRCIVVVISKANEDIPFVAWNVSHEVAPSKGRPALAAEDRPRLPYSGCLAESIHPCCENGPLLKTEVRGRSLAARPQRATRPNCALPSTAPHPPKSDIGESGSGPPDPTTRRPVTTGAAFAR
jgi:hypothetical protein